jgi:hypothetical protein
MPFFYLPEDLRQNKDRTIFIPGKTVGEALDHLIGQYPELHQHFYNDLGEFVKLPSPFLNILIGPHDFRELDGVNTKISEQTCLRVCRTWSAATSGRKY